MKKLTVFFIMLCFWVALASFAPETRKSENSDHETPQATHPNNFFDPGILIPRP